MNTTAIDVSKTIVPKSDQLNADDLLTCSKDIEVTGVRLHSSDDQPISVHYKGEDGRPYKPCKSMRRVLISIWGTNGNDWIGKSMRLYCDPDVKFGGSNVGGIRISHATGIDRPTTINLTVTRSKRAPYTVEPMEPPKREQYPGDKFEEKLIAITGWIKSGEGTPEQAIAYLQREGELSDEQRGKIRAIGDTQ